MRLIYERRKQKAKEMSLQAKLIAGHLSEVLAKMLR